MVGKPHQNRTKKQQVLRDNSTVRVLVDRPVNAFMPLLTLTELLPDAHCYCRWRVAAAYVGAVLYLCASATSTSLTDALLGAVYWWEFGWCTGAAAVAATLNVNVAAT